MAAIGWFHLLARAVDAAGNADPTPIGVAWQVFLVIVVFIASLFHGMGVMIARYAGKQDRETMSEVMVSYWSNFAATGNPNGNSPSFCTFP